VTGETRPDGSVTIGAIPLGLRRVEIQPPDGFTPRPQGLSRDVQVRGGLQVVDFTLIRDDG
jgi:hypothetical protein